jgi:hypothetical protein
MGVGGRRHAVAGLPPGTRQGSHCTGSCVGKRINFDKFKSGRLHLIGHYNREEESLLRGKN